MGFVEHPYMTKPLNPLIPCGLEFKSLLFWSGVEVPPFVRMSLIPHLNFLLYMIDAPAKRNGFI
jgi:hypothetical protein